jgi:DNA-binding XRE family transcriptional regulator
MTAKTCQICGKEFTVPKSRSATAKFCSVACHHKQGPTAARVIKTCDTCGKEFETLACRTEARFCGNDCRNKGYSFALTRPRKSYRSEATRSVAQAVVKRRLELKMKQREVADRANISRATYERVEHGAKGKRHGSSLESVERVLEALGLRLAVVPAEDGE